MRRTWATSLGRLRLEGESGVLDEAYARCLATLERRHTLERTTLGKHPVYLKSTALSGRASWRLGLAALVSGRLPYEREARNLTWLREHGFRAPEPLAAGRLVRAGLPRHQFLFTRAVEAPTLAELARTGAATAELWSALGAEVARLHAAGFVHRDLFPRNILVDALPADPDFVFLDTRRGGGSRPRRDAAYDLACVLLDDTLVPEPARAALLAAYASSRPLPSGIESRSDALARRATRSARPSSSV